MNNLMFRDQSKEKFYYLVFGAILLWVVIFSLSTLTTKPGIWIDEAKSIEIARSWMNYGRLDMQIAPGEFSGFPELLHSTGYPLLIPLATFFKIFGYGIVQARIFMLLAMILALLLVFLFLKNMFSSKEAIFATLLISTFASFYDSGRTVVGEIPGFILLICGLYFWLKKDSYYVAGALWGLSIVTKPSVFGLILPVMILVFVFERREVFTSLCKATVGMIPAALAWIFLVLDNPFSKSVWISIGNFYKNPYSSSVADNIIHNLRDAPHSTTLIYFGFLFLLIILGRSLSSDRKIISLYNFVIIYGIFAFIYYLRSPGWLRYILIAELLVLSLLPNAIYLILAIGQRLDKIRVDRTILAAGFLVILATIQIVQFFTVAEIYYSDAAIKTAKYVNEHFPNDSVAAINALPVSILLDTEKRFNVVKMTGMPLVGNNPLLRKDLPEILIARADDQLIIDNRNILDLQYELKNEANGYYIYKRRY